MGDGARARRRPLGKRSTQRQKIGLLNVDTKWRGMQMSEGTEKQKLIPTKKRKVN